MKKYQLPKEFAEKWVAALRDAEQDTQITGQYYDAELNCYCAMGIGLKANGYKFDNDGDLVGGINPLGDDIWWDIMQLNDRDHKTFPEIADWIEANCEFA